MRYIKTFENHNKSNNDILIIVDVQKSFNKFFTEMYIHELKKGKVTVPFHGKDEINPSTLKSIFKQAGIKNK